MYGIGFDAESAIPLNLIVSLVTLAFSMMVRNRAVSADGILRYLPEVIGLAAGGILSASYGAQLVKRLASKDSSLAATCEAACWRTVVRSWRM
jgi:hypothetical protein